MLNLKATWAELREEKRNADMWDKESKDKDKDEGQGQMTKDKCGKRTRSQMTKAANGNYSNLDISMKFCILSSTTLALHHSESFGITFFVQYQKVSMMIQRSAVTKFKKKTIDNQ